MRGYGTLERFVPGEDPRFVWCCGGYRRWELTWRGERAYWQLASDWGQATVSGLVTPNARFALAVEVDLSELPQGSLTVTLCSRLRLGKPGIDGLQFYVTPALRVSMTHERVDVRGDGIADASYPTPDILRTDPTTVEVASDGKCVSLRLGGHVLVEGLTPPASPCFVLLSGNSGAEEPKGRFGVVELRAE